MHRDADAIDAVKKGDKERFGDLVERYQRMVYAIAWSHVGDADLCDDIAQETFVRGFRYLGALRQPEKFAAWIARIARNIAYSTLRRRCHDLAGLQRWSLEQPQAASPAGTRLSGDEPINETMSAVLAQLPDAHRECLVLFYLEGKSVHESASLLGINENAFKTRLHRARQALRGQMEQRMEESLARLGPKENLRPRVLSTLPLAPIGWGSGFSLGSLAPFMPYVFFTLASKIPFFLYLGWINQRLARNFREGQEFRRSILQKNFTTLIVTMIPFLAISAFFMLRWGVQAFYCLLALSLLPALAQGCLFLRVNRSNYVKAQTIGITAMFLSFLGIGLLGLSFVWFAVAMLIFNVGLWMGRKSLPYRMDYNLFLRVLNDGVVSPAVAPNHTRQLTSENIQDFSRFLGSLYLIADYSRRGSGWTFYLPSVAGDFLSMFLMPIRRFAGASTIGISTDGSCRASLSKSDLRHLRALKPKHNPNALELEEKVAAATQAALGAFLEGDREGATRVLQARGESEIFLKPPHELRSQKTVYYVSIIGAAVMVVCFAFMEKHGFPSPPKRVTRADAQQAISQWIAEGLDRTGSDQGNLILCLDDYLFPPRQFLNENDAIALRNIVIEKMRKDPFAPINMLRTESGLLFNALHSGIFTLDEFQADGFSPASIREWITKTEGRVLPSMLEPAWDHLKTPSASWALESYAHRIWVMKQIGCLDLIDADKVVVRLAEFQARKNTAQEGLLISGSPYYAVRNTWAILFILQTLDRLDRIDRDACVSALLRSVENKMKQVRLFGSRTWRSESDAANAYYGLESLSILNAVEKIPDLKKWEFSADWETWQNGKRVEPFITPHVIETWAWQCRLEEIQNQLR